MENIVNDILAIAPAKTYNIEGNTYTDKKLYRLPSVGKEEKSPDPVSNLTSLSGLISMLGVEAFSLIERHGDIFLHVKSASEVHAFTKFRDKDIPLNPNEILPYGKRQSLYTAKYTAPVIRLNTGLPYETAIIQLNSLFEKTAERDELIKTISSIDRADRESVEDNGISQSVTQRAGVALKEKATVKPIWKLKPFRSFIEAPLAEVSFLLRIDGSFNIGLFECDGGKWELDAKSNIQKFIEGEIAKFASAVADRIFVIT
jgi:hypothetical protein